MRFTSQTSRMAVVAPRPVITRVHSTTNGSAPPDSPASLRTVDIDGVTFVAASQVRSAGCWRLCASPITNPNH